MRLAVDITISLWPKSSFSKCLMSWDFCCWHRHNQSVTEVWWRCTPLQEALSLTGSIACSCTIGAFCFDCEWFLLLFVLLLIYFSLSLCGRYITMSCTVISLKNSSGTHSFHRHWDRPIDFQGGGENSQRGKNWLSSFWTRTQVYFLVGEPEEAHKMSSNCLRKVYKIVLVVFGWGAMPTWNPQKGLCPCTPPGPGWPLDPAARPSFCPRFRGLVWVNEEEEEVKVFLLRRSPAWFWTLCQPATTRPMTCTTLGWICLLCALCVCAGCF